MRKDFYEPISAVARRRFWAKIEKRGPDECWPWMGAKTDKGYGFCFPYGVKGGIYRAHRVLIFLETGVDPGERGGMHSCDNPPCCNPGHVSAASQKDNLDDMRNKGRGGGKFLPHRFGETASHAKLTDAEIAEIRRLAASTPRRPEGHGRRLIPGYWSERRLAEKFGVGTTQIGRIIRGESR